MVGGDLMPHRPQLLEASALGRALAPLSPMFRNADVAIANYETATGGTEDLSPHMLSLAAPPEWAEEARESGLRAVTVANNHACDLGKKGLISTLDATTHAGLEPLGAGEDPWAPRIVAERSGKKVCVVAWTTFSNERGRGCVSSGQLAVSGPGSVGRGVVKNAILRAKKECDAVIAIFHGGEEYVAQTRASLAMGEVAADSGAVAVVIHHPHVVSPLAVYTTKDGRHVPIFASVGNLVSNQGETWEPSTWPARQADRHTVYLNAWTRLGMLADLDVALGDEPSVHWGYHLVWTENDHYKDKHDPHPRIETHVLDDERHADIIERLKSDKTGPIKVLNDVCKIQSIDGIPTCD
jgi:poly-gamma-glutamate capsule biosynthesis protein CapA/YwtB (metallophosphatase superfamily)